MRKIFLVGFFILSIHFQSKSQDWIKTFTDGNYAHPRWVIETYDKGYIILDNETVYSWITDINGNLLFWRSMI